MSHPQEKTLSPKYLIEDIWLEILRTLDPQEFLVIRQVSHWFWSFTSLKELWLTAYRIAILEGRCPPPGPPDVLSRMSTTVLEKRLLRSLYFERQIRCRGGRRVVLPFSIYPFSGRPLARITWLRLVPGMCVLQATSDGFLQCLSIPSSRGDQMDIIGQWSGLGIISSGAVLDHTWPGCVDIAVSGKSQDFSTMYTARIQCDAWNDTASGVSFNVGSRIIGPSNILAMSKDLVCAASFHEENYLHVVRRATGTVTGLVNRENDKPQTVHAATITHRFVVIAKAWVIDLYDITLLLSSDSQLDQISPLRTFLLPHMAWSAGIADYGLSWTHLGPHQSLPTVFGILVRWHDGITLFTLTSTHVLHDPTNEAMDFTFTDQSHISIRDRIGAFAIGLRGFRLTWVSRWTRGCSRLTTCCLLRCHPEELSKGQPPFSLSAPRSLWNGSPSSVLDHCNFVTTDEDTATFLVSQLNTGHSWLLRASQAQGQESHLAWASSSSIEVDPTILRLFEPSNEWRRATLRPVTWNNGLRTPSRIAAPDLNRFALNVPEDLVPPEYSNDWSHSPMSYPKLKQRMACYYHIPGVLRPLIHGFDCIIFEVDGHIFRLNEESGTLRHAPRGGDYRGFLTKMRDDCLIYEDTPCDHCDCDQDAVDAKYRLEVDLAAFVHAFHTASKPVTLGRTTDHFSPKAQRALQTGLVVASRLRLTAHEGVVRRFTDESREFNAMYRIEQNLYRTTTSFGHTVSLLPLP